MVTGEESCIDMDSIGDRILEQVTNALRDPTVTAVTIYL